MGEVLSLGKTFLSVFHISSTEYSMNEETSEMYDACLTGVCDRQQRVPGLLQVRSRRKC